MARDKVMHSDVEQEKKCMRRRKPAANRSLRIYVVVNYASGITLNTVGGCIRHLNAAAIFNKSLKYIKCMMMAFPKPSAGFAPILSVSQCVRHIPVPKKEPPKLLAKKRIISACHIYRCSSFRHNVVLILRCVGGRLCFGDCSVHNRFL